MSAAKNNAAKAAQAPASASPAPSKGLRRFTYDNELIYRPAKWPFEMIEVDSYVVQLAPFVDYGDCIGDGHVHTTFVSQGNGTSELMHTARIFDTAEEAVKYITEHDMRFERREDGNVYPRVLKARLSCIAEGVAFEPVIRDIKGGAKLEGVA